MLSTRQTTFEVQLCRDGRWIIAAQCDGHHEAQALALRLLGERDPEGVRVIRDTVGADLLHKEKVVFQKMNDRPTARQEPTVIGPIASAPVCPDLHAFYETESRLVMGRLFRRYLDAVVLTPTEILHAYRPLRRLMDRDTLFASAVDRVASLQAKASGEPFRSRREMMFKAAHDLAMRARQVDSRTLPAVAALGIDGTSVKDGRARA